MMSLGNERMVEPKSKINQACTSRVSMTTPSAASTGTVTLKKTVETQDTCHILTFKPKGDGWAGGKA